MFNFFWKVCRNILLQPYRLWLYVLSLPERIYNKLHGLDFDTIVPMKQEGHRYYKPSGILARHKIRKYLRGKVTDNDAIIDIGCGKGRMLYFFSQFPFRLVDGLEYSQAMIEIAENNLAILRKLHRGVEAIRVFQGDATLYDAYDEYNYFYLFNPFEEIIMTQFLRHIKESSARNPRDIHIIYHHPMHSALFIAEGFKFEEELPTLRLLKNSKIYVYLLPAKNV